VRVVPLIGFPFASCLCFLYIWVSARRRFSSPLSHTYHHVPSRRMLGHILRTLLAAPTLLGSTLGLHMVPVILVQLQPTLGLSPRYTLPARCILFEPETPFHAYVFVPLPHGFFLPLTPADMQKRRRTGFNISSSRCGP
jgi:hypothetical protein